MNDVIYLDNAATTKTAPEVIEAMLPYFDQCYGNPSSIYGFSNEARKAITNARETIASSLCVNPTDIYFTSGGTESDNWAIKAAYDYYRGAKNHIITTAIEHHAILHTTKHLEKQDVNVTYLPVDEFGFVSPETLEAAITEDTFLISIMWANNEIGTILDIPALSAVAKKHGVLFHTDAVQAYGHVPIDLSKTDVDMLSASGHKFYGPKGVGFLYIKKGVKIGSFMHGGTQERSRRAGTENVSSIVGLGVAAGLALNNMENAAKTQIIVRDYLIDNILKRIPHSRLNGHKSHRLPNNVNICFRFVEGESLLMLLDSNGICASSGSACTSGSLDPSHVLLAIGLPHEIAHGSLRLTISEETTIEEAQFVVTKLERIIERLRAMSPLYEDFIKKNK